MADILASVFGIVKSNIPSSLGEASSIDVLRLHSRRIALAALACAEVRLTSE